MPAHKKYKDGRKPPAKKMLKGKMVYHTAGIPKPKRTLEEKIEVSNKICAMYSTGNYTLEACCKKYKVSWRAFMLWASPTFDLGRAVAEGLPIPRNFVQEIHEMYKNCIKINQTNYTELVKGKARSGLLKKVEGYEVEEVNEEYEVDKELYITDEITGVKTKNPDFGKLKLVKRKVKKYNQAPDTAAIVFALTNVDKENFKERKFVEHKDQPKVEDAIAGLKTLDEISKKRREMETALMLRKKDLEEAEYIESETV